MDDICSACLCSGRKLNFIGDIGCYEMYMQILNEIPMYDTSQVCVRVCWECRAVLHRFHRFRQQVKQSYKELILHTQQIPPSSKLMLIKPSRLQMYNVHNVVYPGDEVKTELDCDFHLEVNLGFNCVKNEDVETHCEPEAFVNDLDLEKLKEKEKKEKKVIKETRKKKTKKKLKGKKNKNSMESKNLPDTNGFSDLETGLDYCDEKDEILEEISKEEKNPKVPECDIHKCEICTEGFKNASELSKHIKNRHSIKSAVVKQKCETGEDKVTQKMSRVRESKLEPLEKKPTCADCGKMFSSRKTYRYHRTVLHQGQNRHPCPRCGKVYQWKSNLGRHMRSHKARDSGELYCSVCDKRFASIATYRQHLRISRKHVSENEFSFMCNECGKKFVNKTRLRDHIDWEHLKKIKFKCQLCNKPFKCHTSLYVHMQNVHRDKEKKDNLCHVCGKSYQNAAKLKYHIVAMHTSETPYQCEQCSAAFGWYSSLYRHVREVHYKMKLQSKKAKRSKRVPPEMFPPLLLAPPAVPPPHHAGPQ